MSPRPFCTFMVFFSEMLSGESSFKKLICSVAEEAQVSLGAWADPALSES